MRKIIISFCILFAALSLQAQSVNGIRIDGGNTPILVYLGGTDMFTYYYLLYSQFKSRTLYC